MCDRAGSVTTLRAASYPNGAPPTVVVPGCAVATPLTTEDKSVVVAKTQMNGYGMTSGVGALIVWFIIIFIITWLILYGVKPDIVMNKDTNQVDIGKLILSAVVISLIIIIIIWLIKSFASKKY